MINNTLVVYYPIDTGAYITYSKYIPSPWIQSGRSKTLLYWPWGLDYSTYAISLMQHQLTIFTTTTKQQFESNNFSVQSSFHKSTVAEI